MKKLKKSSVLNLLDTVNLILKDIKYLGYKIKAHQDKHKVYLQASYFEEDIAIPGLEVRQKTRKWYLSKHMCKNEIVQTAFKCILTSAEHQVREHFLYKGKRIFGPHFDVDALHSICKDKFLDYRR